MEKAEKKQVSLEAGLWNACNKLRGSVTATDYVNVVLGMLFLRFAYDKFKAQREKLLADEETADFIDNPRFYSKDNVFFLEENDRWNYIKDNSKSNKIFTYIDDAFRNMEKNNPTLKGALPIGCAKGLFFACWQRGHLSFGGVGCADSTDLHTHITKSLVP